MIFRILWPTDAPLLLFSAVRYTIFPATYAFDAHAFMKVSILISAAFIAMSDARLASQCRSENSAQDMPHAHVGTLHTSSHHAPDSAFLCSRIITKFPSIADYIDLISDLYLMFDECAHHFDTMPVSSADAAF